MSGVQGVSPERCSHAFPQRLSFVPAVLGAVSSQPHLPICREAGALGKGPCLCAVPRTARGTTAHPSLPSSSECLTALFPLPFLPSLCVVPQCLLNIDRVFASKHHCRRGVTHSFVHLFTHSVVVGGRASAPWLCASRETTSLGSHSAFSPTPYYLGKGQFPKLVCVTEGQHMSGPFLLLFAQLSNMSLPVWAGLFREAYSFPSLPRRVQVFNFGRKY